MGIPLVRVCNELWERASMTTAAQIEGGPGHVVITSNGLFSRRMSWGRYQVLAGRRPEPASVELCGVKRDIGGSGVLACLRHRVFPSRIVGLAWDTGGGWPCCEHDGIARWGIGCLTTFGFVQKWRRGS